MKLQGDDSIVIMFCASLEKDLILPLPVFQILLGWVAWVQPAASVV